MMDKKGEFVSEESFKTRFWRSTFLTVFDMRRRLSSYNWNIEIS